MMYEQILSIEIKSAEESQLDLLENTFSTRIQ
jgi:hypothetical protein